MSNWVEIRFDCLPLRTVSRFDVPLDADPDFRALCQRVKQATSKHGLHNTYYLYNAKCAYHLTNDAKIGVLEFRVEGTVMTDLQDLQTKACDLAVELAGESCDWLTRDAVDWMRETVVRAVQVEFDRFIAAGDLAKTVERLEKLQSELDSRGGFLGMGL